MFFRKRYGRRPKKRSRKRSLIHTLLVNPVSRLLYISLISCSASIGLNYANHQGYWYGTIYRVQTVDFNILAHTLPTKISYAMAHGDKEEIQRTLNSNFGLFGLVVTDCRSTDRVCPNQKILYVTESKLNWRKQLSQETLTHSTYDFIRNTPPLHVEVTYNSPRDETRNPTGLDNSGDIIGRVYYIRGVPPSFEAEFTKWIRGWPQTFIKESGPSKYYSLSAGLAFLGGISAWLMVESVHAKRRQQQREAEMQLREQNLRAEQQLIEHRLRTEQQLREQELRAEQELREQQLKSEQQLREQELRAEQKLREVESKATLYRQQLENQIIENRERDRQYQQVIEEQQQQLKALHLSQAETSRRIQELQQEIQHKSEELTKSQLSLDEIHRNKTQVENAFAQHQQKIQQLQTKLSSLQHGDLQQQQAVTLELATLHQQQKTHQIELSSLIALLETKDAEVERAKQSMLWLQQQVDEADQKQAEFEAESEELRQSVDELMHQRLQDAERIKQLENEREKARQELSKLNNKDSEEIENYRRKLELAHQDLSEIRRLGQDLNEFERQVLSVLEKSPKVISGEWELLTSFDVCKGRGASQMTDFIVVAKNLLVVIEAKGYTGTIGAGGDILNAEWYNQDSCGRRREVKSVGKNPYQQVRRYTISAGDIANHPFTSKTILHYGIVVFPDQANTSALPTTLTDYYSLTKLSGLVSVISDFEVKVRRRNLRQVTASEVVRLLYRERPMQRPMQRTMRGSIPLSQKHD